MDTGNWIVVHSKFNACWAIEHSSKDLKAACFWYDPEVPGAREIEMQNAEDYCAALNRGNITPGKEISHFGHAAPAGS